MNLYNHVPPPKKYRYTLIVDDSPFGNRKTIETDDREEIASLLYPHLENDE